MLVVVTLLSLLAGISYPSFSATIDSLRINTAADDIAALWNASLNRAERRQQPVEFAVSQNQNTIMAISADGSFRRSVQMPSGVRVAGVLPRLPMDDQYPRRFLLNPGGSVPRVGIILANTRGVRRLVGVDPVSGVPRIQRLNPGDQP